MNSVEKDHMLCKISKLKKQFLSLTGNSKSSSQSSSNLNASENKSRTVSDNESYNASTILKD